MPTRTSRATKDYGAILQRGGHAIPVEKEVDRFTVMPSSAEALERVRSAPGVREVTRVTNQVFKVETSSTDRDTAMAAIRSDAFGEVTHHAYRPVGSDGTIYYITDRIAVVFKAAAKPAQIGALLSRYSLVILKEYENQPGAYLVQVTASSGENPVKVANRLSEEAIVESAEPNLVNRFQTALSPTDTYFRRQWHLRATDGPQLLKAASVDAPKAWDTTLGVRQVVVAVIDDGFDLNHPDFQGVGKVVNPRDYVDGDSSPFPTVLHGDYHGTPCAGVAIAERNGRGVVGAAPGCAFMPVRFPLSADDDLLIEIFEEAASVSSVISCSWGPPPANAPISSLLSMAFTRIVATGGPDGRGCVICFAAGNYAAPLRDPVNAAGVSWRGSQGIRRTLGPILNGLATHPSVIAVAASTSENRHSAYSNFGPDIAVSAPSNNFHPLNPQQFVPGRGIFTTDNEAFGDGFTANSRYTPRFGGTSSATPLTAGICALIRSANPNLSAAEVREVLTASTDKIVDNTPDIVLNQVKGVYNPQGRCDWFGFGKVNAAKGVAEAVRRLSP